MFQSSIGHTIQIHKAEFSKLELLSAVKFISACVSYLPHSSAYEWKSLEWKV